MLVKILGGTSILLGLYLIVMRFVVQDPPLLKSDAVYHVGCYDPDYANIHSFNLVKKAEQLKSKAMEGMQLNMYHSKALAEGFDRQVQDLALAFDDYVDNYYNLKVRNERDVNFYNSLQIAKRQFETCSNNQRLNEEQCLKDWNAFDATLTTFDRLKKELGDLIDKKEDKQKKIAAFVEQRPGGSETENEKEYKKNMTKLRSDLDKEEENIVIFRVQKNKMHLELEQNRNNLEDLKSLLNECLSNKELIAYCNSISKDLNKFSKASPRLAREDLEARIATKRIIIDGLQLNLRKVRKYGSLSDIAKTEKDLAAQTREMQLLEAEVTNFLTIEESKCAKCSEQKIAELRRNIIELESQINKISITLSKTTKDLQTSEQKVVELKKKIADLQQARESEINVSFCMDEDCKKKQLDAVLTLERQINQLKKEIIEKNIQINFIKNSQEQKFDKMKKYLEPIEEALSCYFKKQLYSKLKVQAPERTDIGQKMLPYKESVVKALDDCGL